MSTAVSIVDFKEYGLHVKNPQSVKSSLLEKTAEDLYNAFTSTGVCYIVNHGVPQSMIDQLFSVSKTFFHLPLEEKQKCVKGEGNNYEDGWIVLKREILNLEEGGGDLKESFEFLPCGKGKWPSSPPDFESSFVTFYDACKGLTERVLDILSIGLKLEDRSFMRTCHSLIGQRGNQTTLRSLYYPEVPKDGSVKPGQVRCGEHSDYGTVTLLFQDDMGGLEVQNTQGVYVPATPRAGAVIVNVGDLMQRWTVDKLIATNHRVLIPEEEIKRNQSRQSIAFFVYPDDDVIIKCLDGSDKYEPVTTSDYLNHKFSVTYK